MSVPQLLEAHNQLAEERGRRPLRDWRDSRCKLVERVAILRTHKIVTPRVVSFPAKRKTPRRLTPIRNAILKLLAVVDHYEEVATGKKISARTGTRRPPEAVISVGLSYPEILRRLRRMCPESKTSGVVLRWTATQVRNGTKGFERCKLPQKRPHGEAR